MKYSLLFLLFVSIGGSLPGQKLGFSALTPYGGTDDRTQETLHYNSGEPIMTRVDGSNFTMRQGLLNADGTPIVENATIQVRFFFDENEDGRKNFDENFIEEGQFIAEGVDVYTIFKTDGISFDATLGDYTFAYKTSLTKYKLTTDSLITVTVDDQTDYLSVLFGVAFDENCVEPFLKMTSDRFRCFDEVTYRICVMNRGCVPFTDTIYLEIDDRINPDSIFYIDTPDLVIDDHTVGWVQEVTPGNTNVLQYKLVVPEVNDPSDIGEIYKSRVWVELDNGFLAQECFEQELRCSYDPNDKLVEPDRDDDLALRADDLVYTIRFQNTGNDYAEDVLVIDTLSEYLDVSTFDLIYTSHPKVLEISFPRDNGNIIHFRFSGIFLPDSTTNEPGSNGQVMFSISPFEGVELETEIENTGYIYFDRNPAIITNTVKSIMVDEFPPPTSTEEKTLPWDLFLYPNPSNGMIYLNEYVDNVRIYDLAGRLLLDKSHTKTVDCHQLSDGKYIVEIRKEDFVMTEKLILLNNQ